MSSRQQYNSTVHVVSCACTCPGRQGWFLLPLVLLNCTAFGQQTEIRFLQKYCIQCHGAESQEADRRFDQLSSSGTGTSESEAWHEILDRLNLGDMPPEDADPKPSDRERLDMVTRLTKKLAEASVVNSKQQTVLRRLNRREYDAAMRYVLGLEDMLTDPTANFTPDEADHHFDTIGSKLVLSDFLLTRYLEASDKYLNAAREVAERRPEPQTWTFSAPFCRNMPNPDGRDRDGRYQHLRENTSDRYGYLWLRKLGRGVPVAGRYRIQVKAAAVNRQHPYKDMILRTAREDPLRLAIVAGDTRAGDLATNNSSDHSLAEFDVPDDTPTWLETTAWLDKYYQPRFAFPNGPARIKYMRHLLMRHHRDLFPNFLKDHVHIFSDMHPDYDTATGPALEKEFLAEQDRLKKAGQPYDVFGTAHRMHTDEAWRQFYSEYTGPRIRIYEVKIEGPLPEEAEPVAAKFFPTREMTDATAEELIDSMAQRAWRHNRSTVSAANSHVTARRAMLLFRSERDSGSSQLDALQLAYQTILCSPQFLYHRTQHGELSEGELASRLSFFLWGSPPDPKLLQLADEGHLHKPAVLKEQVNRLLDDARSDRFVRSFTDSWLHLSRLGTMLPDRTEHPAYYNERLEDAMRKETQLYVTDAIRRNAPIGVFVDSDYTFINSSLARLYRIDGVKGHAFRRVELSDRNRGGLLGQASVLTATANGIDTSPVLRGVWLLECLLGTPPAPPPPDIEPIEPDTRGTTTIREQLAAHRTVATCNNCHRHIDPPGFALESFDEIGQFRNHYEFGGWQKKQGPRVDPAGRLASGESFADITELKKHLLARSELVARNAATKLLTYASGRLNDPVDRESVSQLMNTLLKESEASEIGFRTLIQRVVASDSFRR